MKRRIFISSVQAEFAAERFAIKRLIEGNPFLRRFFSVFVFELDTPATDNTTSNVYLTELKKCEIYLALIGNDYGTEDRNGISPTEREYDKAEELGLHRIIFVTDPHSEKRHYKETLFLNKVSQCVTWHPFQKEDDLLNTIMESLDRLLSEEGAYHLGPFDSSACEGAAIEDIDEQKLQWFLRTAKEVRNSSISNSVSIQDALLKLNLLTDEGKMTNASLLLFGKNPQRFFHSAKIKCISWYGVERIKPIRSYEVYTGNIFDISDKAVDFVMSKLDRHIGTREHGPQVEITFEIPEKVVAEAINNAIAHRSYHSDASIHVELFADRLEVFSPGTLHPRITPDMLRVAHRSYPNNPLIAEAMYLVKYIEVVGSGTTDILAICQKIGLQMPQFSITSNEVLVTIYREQCENALQLQHGNGDYLLRSPAAQYDPNYETNRDTNDTNRDTNDTNDTNRDTNDTTRDTNDLSWMNDDQRTILEMIGIDRRVTAPQMAVQIHKSIPTVKRLLKTLVQFQKIQRIGRTRGYWKIVTKQTTDKTDVIR